MNRASDPESNLLFEYRRPTATWVKVNTRRLCEFGFLTAVLREGEPQRGSVILKVHDGGAGWRVLSQVRTADGQPNWMEGLDGRSVAESEALGYLQRSVARDPDIWIIEIRQPEPRHSMTTASCSPPLRARLSVSG